MVTCPQLAISEIRRMESLGITLTLDEMTTMILTAREVESPRRPVIPGVNVPPVAVCDGVILWPATLQAEMWHAHAIEWWDGDTIAIVKAYAYALAHGRISGHFEPLYDRPVAVLAVNRWASSIAATIDELSGAIIALSPENYVDIPADPNERRSDWGDILCEIVAETGIPLDHWLTNTSHYALSVLEKAYRTRIVSGGGSWKEDPSRRGMMQFMAACMEIRKAHNV